MEQTTDRSVETARRTQAERRDESGRNLVQAAIAVVAEDGVGAATFEAIGRKAGYSRGLATQRFGSKQGLIEAVIAHLHERQEVLMSDNGIDALPGFKAVLAYVDLFVRGLGHEQEARAYFMLLSSAVADLSTLRSAFADEHGKIRRRLEALVRRGRAEGDIRPEIDPDAAALMIGSLLLGLSMQLMVDPTTNLEPIRETSLATLRLSFGVPGRADP
ncbi:MAG: TetR/AcrR family transcriptional regulator [Caulobacteraceae bacterium]|nr:TetR/AcrR family transcriptional regulator [Caulobacteraceae bacterium]